MGYIYIRNHESYGNVRKLGQTNNIPNRDALYTTGEHKRGYFELVFEVEQHVQIEKLLQRELVMLNDRNNGGIEFYNKHILHLVEQILITHSILYKKLSNDEIKNLCRTYKKDTVEPRVQQQEIIDEVINDNPDKVLEFKNGKDKLFGFFVGETMRKSSGKANPKLVNDLLNKKLR